MLRGGGRRCTSLAIQSSSLVKSTSQNFDHWAHCLDPNSSANRSLCSSSWRRFLDRSNLDPATACTFSLSVGCRELNLLTRPLLFQQLRGVKILGAEVKQGNIIEQKGYIFQVLKTQHTQQGRGGATIQLELRDIQSGLKSSKRLRTTEAIEKVFVEEREFTFLYNDGDNAIFMEPRTFEQVEVSKAMFGNRVAYLSDGVTVTMQFFDGKPLSATVPSRVTCTIVEAEPSYQGQSATPLYKNVILENGIHVMVPTFINAGDQIVVDTTDDSYVTRAKN